jgi:hypothetical protein
LWANFVHGKSYVLILKKNWVGPHFGRFFNKLIWGLAAKKTFFDVDGLQIQTQLTHDGPSSSTFINESDTQI